jgi:hypothetical protein
MSHHARNWALVCIAWLTVSIGVQAVACACQGHFHTNAAGLLPVCLATSGLAPIVSVLAGPGATFISIAIPAAVQVVLVYFAGLIWLKAKADARPTYAWAVLALVVGVFLLVTGAFNIWMVDVVGSM